MSRIAIVGDLHIGARNASAVVAEYQLKFLTNQLLTTLKTQKITEIIQLGDVFETRKYSNHIILDKWKTRFFDLLDAAGINVHIILGNHDISYRNTLSVNSPNLFLSHYKNVHIYDKPQDVKVEGFNFLFLPWICTENYDDSMALIKKSKSKIALGHLELANFEMYRGQLAHEGMDKKIFKRFSYVFSGHYHHRSDDGHIYYFGSPFEFTWADYNDPRGFYVFDPTNSEFEFIKNEYNIFCRVEYNDKDKGADYWKTFDKATFKDKYVKLIVVNKTDPYQFDRLLDVLYNADTIDFKIVEDMSDFTGDAVDDVDLELEDSMTLVDSYVDAIEFDGNKEKLKTLMKSLYVESLSVLE